MSGNEQFGRLLKENEELTTDLERTRNEMNVLRIELSEQRLRASNLQADLKLEAGIQTDLKRQVAALQEQLNEALGRVEDGATALEAREEEIKAVERLVGCRLTEFGKLHGKTERLAEEAEVFRREIAFIKNIKHRVDVGFVSEQRVQSILGEFYKSLNVVQQTADASVSDIPEKAKAVDCQKNSVLMQKVAAYEEELTQQREKAREAARTSEELAAQLKKAKVTIASLAGEVEMYRQRSALTDGKSNSFDFRRALKNLEKFDQDLKDVYSSCIDLFVSLDKGILIKMEKSLNDCVIEFKEIREMLINRI